MMEQTGEEIDWEKCPNDLTDFPDIVIDTLNIFNSLGARVYPDVGYVGKDFTNLELLLEMYGIEQHQLEYVFDLLLVLDSREIKDSQDKLKAEYNRIKSKNK